MKTKKKRDVTKLQYGIIHSQIGFSDGVSIVIEQVEEIMTKNLSIPKKNLHYLVGKAAQKNQNTIESEEFWHKSEANQVVNKYFTQGFGGALSEKVEVAILKAKEELERFVAEKKVDVLIVHNSSHPVNFIYSVAISRYYRDQQTAKKGTPKYIVWWHDSHLERERYKNPARDVKNYLLEGVPGKYVDHTIFINSLQFKTARAYYKMLDERQEGLFQKMFRNKTVVYNTATTPIKSLKELSKKTIFGRTETFLKDFKIEKNIKKQGITLKDTQIILQHTRVVERKRIDFALEYAYALLSRLQERKLKKAIVFIISGNSGDEQDDYKGSLKALNKKLAKKYNTKNFHLIFQEDIKTDITFEEIPRIISKLGGITTYFSEVEGFGNNLLEVLAGGLIPIIYEYPVFKKDIAKYNFNLISFKEFKITEETLKETIKIIEKPRLRTRLANENIKNLRKNLSHETIAPKLKKGILKRKVILS